MSPLTHSIARGAVGLGLFAIVTAGVVGLTHSLTFERIVENRLASEYQALEQVVPAALHDNDLVDGAITLPAAEMLGHPEAFTAWQARQDGQISAIILPVTTRQGYSGDISLLAGIAADGTLTGVRVLSHRETPGLGDKIDVRKSDWIEQFAGLSLGNPPPERWAVKEDGGAFDAFTGATVTPRAVVGAVQRSLEYFAAHRERLLQAPEETTDESIQ
ncbi:electron transport complex protein RnfG [Modicisalibacter ilicicola DSM 19980]|uniref:Ion-translocating oxidoreductase complex subunit G n=1 Tax=Modicisalibacter ilicicola DSM 19980 TaxID=1121942 RepID=A0A1M4ZC56_9GAMM|nr:electron transport complex subunit RsxG [Halomonas ilicicola]SHF15176.1 electron transport complex protein RnfG [Halomonas ilicicola DSM 19980]